eukprot:TRINITY_DN4846_c0_g1_i1.p1 TRINITY_DN4846_c0_g1~~TRINITY_DN4846_c0_g1_i1.p1  ORF type:complete len:328 (+),score=105.36 TRINITY_DN4846_c0_g1_i1:35-985(+)
MSLPGANDNERLENLCLMTYKEQAVWFLNAYWKQFAEKEAENIWTWKHMMDEFDLENKAQGHKLDELNAHRFLEKNGETLTVLKMREALRVAGVKFEVGVRKYMPFIHYLVIKFKVDWKELVNATQGDNQEEVRQAQAKLDQVSAAFEEVQKTAEIAKAREADAIAAEAASKEAQKELEAALAELKAQEEAYKNKTESLKKASETGGIVSRNRAKADLAIHLGEDPLPLRRAKINTEAAVRKAEKATKAAEKAVAEAKAATIAAEAAVEEAMCRVEEAEAYLEEVKSKPGSAEGSLWWISRELAEKKKYLPQRKRG